MSYKPGDRVALTVAGAEALMMSLSEEERGQYNFWPGMKGTVIELEGPPFVDVGKPYLPVVQFDEVDLSSELGEGAGWILWPEYLEPVSDSDGSRRP